MALLTNRSLLELRKVQWRANSGYRLTRTQRHTRSLDETTIGDAGAESLALDLCENGVLQKLRSVHCPSCSELRARDATSAQAVQEQNHWRSWEGTCQDGVDLHLTGKSGVRVIDGKCHTRRNVYAAPHSISGNELEEGAIEVARALSGNSTLKFLE